MIYTRKIYAALIATTLFALPYSASANCYADYKAKQTSGDLQLHYGVVQIPDDICGDLTLIEPHVQTRIGADGWQVLRIMSSFDDADLKAKQEDAGEYFLRY